MKTKTEPEVTPKQQAMEIVGRLSRTAGFPKDGPGIEALADGLLKASVRTQVPMRAIVDRFSETSKFCPTDADLISVAVELRDAERNRNPPNLRREWERQYGPPKAIPFVGHAGTPRHVELWRLLKQKYPTKWPDYRTLAVAARELGFEDYAEAWSKL
jgi:hypothetical protein